MNYEAILAEKNAFIASLQQSHDDVAKSYEDLQKKHAGLQDQYIVLQQTLSNQLQHQIELQHTFDLLRQELAQLKKLIFGSKRERFITDANTNQLSLFESEIEGPVTNEVTKQHIEYERNAPEKHPGRMALPDHLPVEEVIIEPTEDISGMKRIGEEVTETLEYTPASLIRKRIIRPKYAKVDGDGVCIGKLPSRAIPKCIAEASLLSHITVSKFIDHMPFYRQIQRFKREYNWDVSDSTINEWFVSVCTLLHPLYEVLKRKILHVGYLGADESGLKVLDRDHEKGIHQGYLWVYYSPDLKWVYFNYRKGRGQHGPKEILSGYQGILQTDGYRVYDKFGDVPGIILVGCLAHVRRKYHEAKDTHKDKCEEALALIQRIYAIEREGHTLCAEERKSWRDEHMRPLFSAFREWIDHELRTDIGTKSDYAKAVSYTSKQWHKLIRILDHGQVELDNNLIENKIRPLALGRKNYLFAGSHAAAERIAMMYSFFGSCKAHDINPYEWLKSTLERIPETKLSNLENLLPGKEV